MVGTPVVFRRYAAPLRVFFGVAALLGVFAMHGLAAHGTTHAERPLEATAVSDGAESDHAHRSAALAPAGTAPKTSAWADQAPGAALLAFTGMCLAVLLGGAVAGALRRGPLGARRLGRALRVVAAPAPGGRHRDPPPCLFALSIQRC